MSYYPQTSNMIKFSTKSSLVVTSYAFATLANFLLVSQHIFSAQSRIPETVKFGLFVAALSIVAINAMILLYLKSKKMPRQGISQMPQNIRPNSNFIPIFFTIMQIILMGLLIALFALSYTTVDTTTKAFIITSIVVLNIGIILMVWNFSVTYCGPFRPQMGMQGYNQGYNQIYNQGFGAPGIGQYDQFGNPMY